MTVGTIGNNLQKNEDTPPNVHSSRHWVMYMHGKKTQNKQNTKSSNNLRSTTQRRSSNTENNKIIKKKKSRCQIYRSSNSILICAISKNQQIRFNSEIK